MISHSKSFGFLVVIIGFLLATSALPGQSEEMRKLYTASWPVSDQSVTVRNKALSNAFAQVLVRASGHRKVLKSSTIRASLSDAASYMRLYSYKKLNLQEQKVYGKPLLLKVDFDPGAVARLLQDAGQPVWNNNRPSGTFWIAIDNRGQRKIAADGQDEVAITVRRQANSRGLPVTLPLMDLDDKSAVSIADVWGKFAEPVNRASRRYNSDYVVMGSLSRTGNGWQASWLVDLGNDDMRFTTNGASSQQAVARMVHRVADRLATKLAVVLSNQIETNYVLIRGLSSLESYAKAQNLLAGLSMVKSANAIQVREDEILFKLELQSASRYLIDALEMNNHLYRSAGFGNELAPDMGDGFNNQLNQDTLVYSWRG